MNRLAVLIWCAACSLAAQTYLLTTIAGGSGGIGDGGPATEARFETITAVAADTAGDIFIADGARIRVLTPDGTIRTLAGRGISGADGDLGPALAATTTPNDVAVDGAANVYIAESRAPRVRKIAPDGTISTVAGTGVAGFSGDGGPAAEAQLSGAAAVAADSSGNLYISDPANHRVRKVSPDGTITTAVLFTGLRNTPGDLAIDAAGQLYVAFRNRAEVVKIDPLGALWVVVAPGQPFSPSGEIDGLALDASGNLYVAGILSQGIVRLDPQGNFSVVGRTPVPVSVAADGRGGIYVASRIFPPRLWYVAPGASDRIVAGAGVGDGHPANLAYLRAMDLTVDRAGDIYVSDTDNQRIRRIDRAGSIHTIAGTGVRGYFGDGGPAIQAQLNWPRGIAVDAAGNVYVADSENHRVRRIDPSGTITTVAGTGRAGYTGDGVQATASALNWPTGVALDSAGNLYVAEPQSHRVRKITPGGIISTFAGTGLEGSTGDGGRAAEARLNVPTGLVVDEAGNVYIAETAGYRVRKVSPGGIITTIASDLTVPGGLAIDRAGNVYVSQSVLYRIWKIPPGGSPVVFAGTGVPGLEGDGGPALLAQLASPGGLAIDAQGAVLFLDTHSPVSYIRKLEPANIFPRWVVNAASLRHDALAPGEVVTLYWADMNPPEPASIGAPVNSRFPNELGGTRVFFDGAAAPVLYVDRRQVNTIVPHQPAYRQATQIQVQCLGKKSNLITLALTGAAPALFTIPATGLGQAAILNEDSTVNSPALPAARGSIVAMFGTGAGQTSPPGADGAITGAQPGRLILPARVEIGGIEAEVLYAGAAPVLVAGVFQVNARVPAAVRPGDYVPVRLIVGGATSHPAVTLAVK